VAIEKYRIKLADHISMVDPVTLDTETIVQAAMVTSLPAGTRFYFQIQAYNALGWSPWSTIVYTDTLSRVRVKILDTWRNVKVWVKVGGTWVVARVWKKNSSGTWVI
jgi:hypothetical protein